VVEQGLKLPPCSIAVSYEIWVRDIIIPGMGGLGAECNIWLTRIGKLRRWAPARGASILISRETWRSENWQSKK
jgi:hypothetical protein